MQSIKLIQDFNSIIKQLIANISGKKLVNSYLGNNPANTAPLALLAIGKAAVSMAEGAALQLDEQPQKSLVITKHKHYNEELNNDEIKLPNLQVIESGHPIPDEMSLKAGEEVAKLCAWLKQQCVDNPSADNWVLCLISGGTSALVEKLKPGISLEELQKVNRHLLSSGQDIAKMNQQRKQMSLLKQGGLANLLPDIPVTGLYLSDVPTNDPAVIGSGVLKSEERQKIHHEILADNNYARKKAAGIAEQLGYRVVVHPELLETNIDEVAEIIHTTLQKSPDVLHIWGGEPVIELPDNPGMGGRNQHLALIMADKLAGDKAAGFASIGTDGSDGMTEYAGAIIDNTTKSKISNLEQEIAKANSMNALLQADACLYTGASGSNLMDIILAYHTS